jgi:hypothetical protein
MPIIKIENLTRGYINGEAAPLAIVIGLYAPGAGLFQVWNNPVFSGGRKRLFMLIICPSHKIGSSNSGAGRAGRDKVG